MLAAMAAMMTAVAEMKVGTVNMVDLVRLHPDHEKNRALLYGELTKMGYKCVRPDGAFYLFMEAPGGDAKAFSEARRCKNLTHTRRGACPGDREYL